MHAIIVAFSDNEVSFVGLEQGTTTATLWFNESQEPLILQVEVPGNRAIDLAAVVGRYPTLVPSWVRAAVAEQRSVLIPKRWVSEARIRYVYPFDQAPLQKIFGPAQAAMLNLVTCNGTFDRGAKNS